MAESRQRGFTLLEILLAIAIGSILLTTIYGVFSAVSRTRDNLEAVGEQYHQARVLFDRLASELRSGYFNPASQQTRLVGGKNSEGYPFLEFSTTLSTPLFGGRAGGVSVVRYEQQQEDREVHLYRNESFLLTLQQEQDPQLLISGLEGFELRYYANGDWAEEWDSRQLGSLPEMVELTLEMEVEGRQHRFQTSIALVKN